MTVNLNAAQYNILMTSLDYAKQRIENAAGTPANVKAANLRAVEEVREVLIAARNAGGE